MLKRLWGGGVSVISPLYQRRPVCRFLYVAGAGGAYVHILNMMGLCVHIFIRSWRWSSCFSDFICSGGGVCICSRGWGTQAHRGGPSRSRHVHALFPACSRLVACLFSPSRHCVYLPRGNVRLWLNLNSFHYLRVLIDWRGVFFRCQSSRCLVIYSL